MSGSASDSLGSDLTLDEFLWHLPSWYQRRTGLSLQSNPSFLQIKVNVRNHGCPSGLGRSFWQLLSLEVFYLCPAIMRHWPPPVIGIGAYNSPQWWVQADTLSQHGRLWLLLLQLQRLRRLRWLRRLWKGTKALFLSMIFCQYILNCVGIDRNLIEFKYKT